MISLNDERTSWLDQILFADKKLRKEFLIFGALLILSIISRLYNLGLRVMSHDENTHVFYAWRFYRGQGLAHDPLMHGPFHLHLVALSYFLFGDSDFTARIPSAVFSIATVGFMWFYRRYLGKIGGVLAALLFLISPYMLYYGRYVRNEPFVALFGVISLWSILRFLDTQDFRYAYVLMAVSALHFTAKETAFIYTAQALVFLAGLFVYQISSEEWIIPRSKKLFFLALLGGFLFLVAFGVSGVIGAAEQPLNAAETVAPSMPGEEPPLVAAIQMPEHRLIFLALCVVLLMFSLWQLIRGYGWKNLCQNRAASLVILLSTMVIPQLSAFPLRFMGWPLPTNASEVMALTWDDIWRIALFVIPLVLISVGVGLAWNRKQWLINVAIFYGLFTVFFTSIFTNGAGFFTGLVGSLGYWLEQQGVNRGSQPWYYYAFVQIPVYEYLPAIGTLLALGMVFFRKKAVENESPSLQRALPEPVGALLRERNAPVAIQLFVFWAVTSLFAYTLAGEKMPWLTVHITMPMILSAAWAFDKLAAQTHWEVFRSFRAWLALILLVVFSTSAVSVFGSFWGTHPPFQGKTLEQLRDTSTFLTSFLVMVISAAILRNQIKTWALKQTILVFTHFILGGLAFLTARTAFQAAYINYDNANELLVYAHSSGGVKLALRQIEEISLRLTNGTALQVAYDNATSYPYWWYLRNYPNQRYYGSDPTRSLRDVPVILVGDENYGKIEPIVGNAYYRFDYIRLWWPNQDYFNLTWERIWNALSDASMREALFQIWLNRDYTLYGKLTNRDMSLPNWSPSARMRLYIRKDIVAQLWEYGAAPSIEEVEADPFEGKQVELFADRVIGEQGTAPGQFQRPRDIEIAADGSLYVVDTDNHRIQHLSADGNVLHVWGSYGDVSLGVAPPGTFNQPWGIGLASDGTVYVADTWNHRIQKFSAEGEFITMWGYFGQGEAPQAFWGPRDVAVDEKGRVFVTDTGNKRVVIFDAEGNYITQFGGAGYGPGQLDEPVGIAIDLLGRIYIADTWNRRIQVFVESEENVFVSIAVWDLVAWFGQSLDNKPYLDVDHLGNVFAADPEGYRIMQFTIDGQAVRFWGEFGTGLHQFGMPASVAVDAQGGVWVVDSGNHRLMHFILPEQGFAEQKE